MGELPCPLCDRSHPPGQIRKVGERELCTYSEEWRFECEVRYALSLPDKARKPRITKLDYLMGVEQQRGTAERTRLRNEMIKRYKK